VPGGPFQFENKLLGNCWWVSGLVYIFRYVAGGIWLVVVSSWLATRLPSCSYGPCWLGGWVVGAGFRWLVLDITRPCMRRRRMGATTASCPAGVIGLQPVTGKSCQRARVFFFGATS
jgi:hypothetical protein